jgi:Ice-binding-like/PEP-CTERM motif
MRPHSFPFVVPLVLAVGMFGVMLAPLAYADTLKSADSYAVLAGSTVTNVDATIITGDLGVSPGTGVTGFPPGIVNGTIHTGTDAGAVQAQSDLTNAFTNQAALPSTGNIVGGVLTGLNLGPGVYTVGAAASNLTGTLTLHDGGVAGSIFVFQMSSTLITSPNAVIDVSRLLPTDSLFWVVGSTATLGDNTVFDGNILALTNIIFDPGATDLCGRALARNGEVTFAGQGPTSLIENQVSIMGCSGHLTGSNGLAGGTTTTGGGGGGTSVPEPDTLLLLGFGFAGLGMTRLANARRV